MNISKTSSKCSDITKKELSTQCNLSVAAVDQRKALKDNVDKDFIGILRMKYEMEMTYLKSLDKIQRICQEKVDKHSKNIDNSSLAGLTSNFIRAYGVSLQHRYEGLDDYLKFLSEFIDYMSSGLETITHYSVEKSKESIQLLYKEVIAGKQMCDDDGKNYRNAFAEYFEAFEKYTHQKNKKGARTSSGPKDNKLVKMQERVDILRDKLNSCRFVYLTGFEQTNNLTDLLENEQQKEGEQLYYHSFIKSLAEAYFKKEDDYLVNSRYSSSGCLSEVLSMEHDYSFRFSTSPNCNYVVSPKFAALINPKDKYNNIFEESYDVISKDVDLNELQSGTVSLYDRRKAEGGKITMEIDSWLNYCQKLTTSPISDWPRTDSIIQENMFFEEMRIYQQLTQSLVKRKTYEYLTQCAYQKKIISSIKSIAESRINAPVKLSLDTCEKDKDGVPAIISKCVDYIFKFGLTSKGIFRISVVSSEVLKLDKILASGDSIPSGTNVNIVAALLKQLIRNLSNFVTNDSTQILLKVKDFNSRQKLECYYISCQFLDSLKQSSRQFFFYLLRKLYELSQSAEQTLMTAFNLAIVFQPNIFKIDIDTDVTNITLLNDIYTFMIENVEEITTRYEKYRIGKFNKSEFTSASSSVDRNSNAENNTKSVKSLSDSIAQNTHAASALKKM